LIETWWILYIYYLYSLFMVILYRLIFDVFSWPATCVIGSPKVYPNYGDIPGAWAPGVINHEQFLEVIFWYLGKMFGNKLFVNWWVLNCMSKLIWNLFKIQVCLFLFLSSQILMTVTGHSRSTLKIPLLMMLFMFSFVSWKLRRVYI
jgi:hypothetical protein